MAGRRRPQVVTLLTSLLSLITVAGTELQRCTVNEDCPTGGFCFKDECSRCLCAEGYHPIHLFTESRLTKVCQKEPEETTARVFDSCNPRLQHYPLGGSAAHGASSSDVVHNHGGVGDDLGLLDDEDDLHLQCPLDSHCDDSTSTCLCNRGLRPHSDRKRCRLGVYNEPCSRRQKCDIRLGLQCKGRPGRCKCKASHHRPSKWTRFVLSRWDYSKVVGEPQECVARAVGEPCQSDAECGAVQGSGAICGLCGFCECHVIGHVPDVLGTTCGPGMGVGQTCTINSQFVCDGTRGLQCGDVCDLYAYDFRPKICRCSQMHDRLGAGCVAKQVGSPCYTDLDCYPVTEGFGYCDGGRCKADARSAGREYQPYLASRDCRIKRPMSTLPPGGTKDWDAGGPGGGGGGGSGHRKHKHERHRNLTHAHHQQEVPVHAGKYHDDDRKSSLVVSFDNLTDVFSIEVTTSSRQNTDRRLLKNGGGVRELSSAGVAITTTTGSQSPSALQIITIVLYTTVTLLLTTTSLR